MSSRFGRRTLALGQALLERVPPPERFNSNLLSFPAEVAGDPR